MLKVKLYSKSVFSHGTILKEAYNKNAIRFMELLLLKTKSQRNFRINKIFIIANNRELGRYSMESL